MKRDRFSRTRVAAAVAGFGCAIAGSQALGAGFALQEQNASGLGTCVRRRRGGGRRRRARFIPIRPACSVCQTRRSVVAGNVICPSIEFSDSGSQPAAFQPLGGTGGDAGSCAVVPELVSRRPDQPTNGRSGWESMCRSGSQTEYDSDWLGRFQAIKSEAGDDQRQSGAVVGAERQLTVGGGVNWQQSKATLSNHVNYAGAFAQGVGAGVAAGQIPRRRLRRRLSARPPDWNRTRRSTGNDSGWGWNIGVLWQADRADPHTAPHTVRRSNTTFAASVNYQQSGGSGPLPPALAPVGAVMSAWARIVNRRDNRSAAAMSRSR